jgi:hypothetical protein
VESYAFQEESGPYDKCYITSFLFISTRALTSLRYLRAYSTNYTETQQSNYTETPVSHRCTAETVTVLPGISGRDLSCFNVHVPPAMDSGSSHPPIVEVLDGTA